MCATNNVTDCNGMANAVRADRLDADRGGRQRGLADINSKLAKYFIFWREAR
jgi:hypothetical protein